MTITNKIYNLTQHVGTNDQRKSGLVEPNPETKKTIQQILTFNNIKETNIEKMRKRAVTLATICLLKGYKKALIGGAPFFMPVLAEILFEKGIHPVFAFSKRKSVEEKKDGKVIKKSIFQFEGWIELKRN